MIVAEQAYGEKASAALSRSYGQAEKYWVKHPGESDGSCRSGEPGSGVWWNDYAVDLVKRSGY